MFSEREGAKWLTAIPLHYTGGDAFWSRDAGLICLGMREIGIDCRFVALGPESQPADAPVILTSLENMRNADWWRQWGADNVLFYCWAAPRYESVSRAIREAGSRLIVRLDSDGINSPRTDFWRYLRKTFCDFHEQRKPLAALQALAKTILFRVSRRVHDDKVLEHLRHADYIAIESPIALQRYRRYLSSLGAPALAEKLRVVPHPVPQSFRYDPNKPKERKILAVGRWESIFKDTPRMVKVLAAVLQREPDYRATIVGSGAEIVRGLLARYDENVRSRIDVRDRITQAELLAEYQPAQIILVTSRSESFHIVAATGLCCGCSVVGSPNIPAVIWFTSGNSGTVAASRSTQDLTDATCAEIAEWRGRRRTAEAIGEHWTALVKMRAVASQCIELFMDKRASAFRGNAQDSAGN